MAEIINKNPNINIGINDQLIRKGIDEQNPPLVPVFVANDQLFNQSNIVATGAATNATGATLYTTPNRDDVTFYLTGATLSTIKDASSPSTAAQILVYVASSNIAVLTIKGLNTTAQNATTSITFPNPIPIDKNTAITVNNTSATANVSTQGTIYGFLSPRRQRLQS